MALPRHYCFKLAQHGVKDLRIHIIAETLMSALALWYKMYSEDPDILCLEEVIVPYELAEAIIDGSIDTE